MQQGRVKPVFMRRPAPAPLPARAAMRAACPGAHLAGSAVRGSPAPLPAAARGAEGRRQRGGAGRGAGQRPRGLGLGQGGHGGRGARLPPPARDTSAASALLPWERGGTACLGPGPCGSGRCPSAAGLGRVGAPRASDSRQREAGTRCGDSPATPRLACGEPGC